jgi:alkaline phosphatase D
MPDRRRFLTALAALGASRAAPARATDRRVSFDSYPFALGVASGYPQTDGMVLWTRLLGDFGPVAIPVRWEVAADEAMRTIVANGEAVAQPGWAHSVHVEPKGLAAGRWYWYRFTAGEAQSAVGRTRTAPPAGDAAARLRFAFASCQHYEHGYFSAHRHLAGDDLDLCVFLGDYIYESSLRRGQVRMHETAAEPITLEQYRARHALYKSDENLQSAHRALPWIVTWDDHEVDNDYANDRQEDGATAEEFLLRRAAAYQAYYEHMPLPARMRPSGPAMKIYTTLDWGTLARFTLLDSRQYRSAQACPKKAGGGADVDPRECAELREPARTLLGAEQEAWLDARFADSRAQWNVVAQQGVMAQVGFVSGANQRIWSDGWDGYPAARARLLQSVVARGLANPVVIGGDTHMHFVNDLKRDFGDPDSPTVASEFAGASITSSPGAWQKLLPAVMAANPHVKYARGDRRGYVRASVTGGRFSADLVGLDTVRKPDSRAEVIARFVVEDGKAGPQSA